MGCRVRLGQGDWGTMLPKMFSDGCFQTREVSPGQNEYRDVACPDPGSVEWFQSSTITGVFPNYWLVGGAAILLLLLRPAR